MAACQQNFQHAQELQKQAHNKAVKPQSYAPGNKVWLSSKHLKTKRNRKLKAKFLDFFQVLHLVGKQAYKLELPKKWKIHDIFHVSLLERDTTKRGWVNDMQLEFKADNNKEYEIDGIWDSVVYAKESAGQLPGLYYLVLWKGYPEKENTWEPALAIQHLWKFVTVYHKDNPEKQTATSDPVDMAPPIAKPSALLRPIAKPTTVPKQGRPTEPTTAPTKKRGWPARSTTTTTKGAKKS